VLTRLMEGLSAKYTHHHPSFCMPSPDQRMYLGLVSELVYEEASFSWVVCVRVSVLPRPGLERLSMMELVVES
jgi:hypothetical protein